MAITKSFREIAIEASPKQNVLVDYVTEESPILNELPMEATSDGVRNIYEKVVSVTGAEIVEFDAALPSMDVTTELDKIDLSAVGGKIEIGEDKVQQFGGLDKYIAKKLPKILRETGNRMEYSIFYNNLRASAAGFGKLQAANGVSTNNYTIMCVKWSPGEVIGLYDPSGFGRGKDFFDIQMLNNGALHTLSTGIEGYAMRIKTYMGIQVANPDYISGIVNIDINAVSGTPTVDAVSEAKLDKMLIDARANPANTRIYCRPEVKSYLNRFKGFRMEMMPMDRNVDRRVDTWNGIPIITSYNLAAGNEALVSV